MRRFQLLPLVLLTASCAGPRAYTRGVYADPQTIQLLSDRFTESDLQLIAKKMTASLDTKAARAKLGDRPLVMVGRFQNRTSEHVDMHSLADKVRVALDHTGHFRFVAAEARPAIAHEYAYEGAGFMAPAEAKTRGHQSSPGYLLEGELASIRERVGGDEMVYYKMTLSLVDVKTGVVRWTDEKELRKKFQRQAVVW